MWGAKKGVGLVTRGSVCCLSSSRCSNIFFFVMMPNTILKHTLVVRSTAQTTERIKQSNSKLQHSNQHKDVTHVK